MKENILNQKGHNMHVLILDTETTAINTPFCYDISYLIINTNTKNIEKSQCYIIKQTWNNLPLFESAYYKDRRNFYEKILQTKSAYLVKWEKAMTKLQNDIKQYNIQNIYAYNSQFDNEVINYNCNWFRCQNPLNGIPFHDIWGYASQYITSNQKYIDFCESNQYFTDTGNYKSSAEIVYRYITNDIQFNEKHMGLYDCLIESKILLYCVDLNAEWNKDYHVNKILLRNKPVIIKINDKIVYKGEYYKKYICDYTYTFKTQDI